MNPLSTKSNKFPLLASAIAAVLSSSGLVAETDDALSDESAKQVQVTDGDQQSGQVESAETTDTASDPEEVSAETSQPEPEASSSDQPAVVVTPNRQLDMISVVGRATSGVDSRITSEELDNRQASDLSDIFRADPTVSVSGSVGMSQKIYVRNIGEDSLNISVDGADQSGSIFHHSGRIVIEPELLKQVEVEAGAGSAAAGPGALGGTVRFTTKDPADLLKTGETSGVLLKGAYYSNGDGYKASATVFGRDESDRFSGMASFIGSDYDNLEDGDGNNILGSEAQQQLGYAKAVGRLTKEQTMSLSYENLTEEGKINYKPEYIATPKNVPEPTEGERETWTLNYDFLSNSSDALDLAVTLYNTEIRQTREYQGTVYSGGVETQGLNVQNKSLIGDHQLVYGLNYRDDSSVFDAVPSESPRYDETGSVTGIFLQDIYEMTHQLTLSAGVRFDEYQLTDVNEQDFKESGVSPNISANFEFTPGYSVSLGYGEAFRGPEVKDAFKISSSSNAEDLDGETAKNLELGFDVNQGPLDVSVGVFNSVIEDPIGLDVPWAKQNTNLEDDIESTGYFLSAGYTFDKLRISASYNSTDTEMNDEIVTRYVYSSTAISIGDTLVTDVSYDVSRSLSMGWTAQFVADIDETTLNVDDTPVKVEKPGYNVHDVYVRWLPTDSDLLTVTLTVKNLLNEQYLDHGSVEDLEANPGWEGIVGSPEPGQDVRLSIALRL